MDIKTVLLLSLVTFFIGFKSAMIYNDSKRLSELNVLAEIKQNINQNQANLSVQLEEFKKDLTSTYENVKIKEINTIVEKPVYKNIAIDNEGIDFLEKNRQNLQNKRHALK